MYLVLPVRVRFLTQKIYYQLLLVLGLGKSSDAGETAVPGVAAAVQCIRCFRRQALPSQSGL